MVFVVGSPVDDVDPPTQLPEELADLLRRVLQVVVERDDDAVARRADPAQQRVVLSVVAAHADAVEALVAFGEPFDHGPCVVASAVLDQDDLVAVGELVEGVGQAPMQFL